jgi:chemotaxis protein methyltransferase CheR
VHESNTQQHFLSRLTLSDKEFNLIRKLIYDNFGINLTEHKRTLIIGRLQKKLRQLGISSFLDYYNYLIADKTGQALNDLVNRISTNHTYFMREKEHFDFYYQHALPETILRHKNSNDYDIRIWCAGCSTGEEAYLLDILLMKFLGSDCNKWDAGVLATDISGDALLYAQEGLYDFESISELPADIKKYFVNEGSEKCRVIERIRKELTFRRFNLMNEKFPFKKPFDVIFCRNVMIYFDNKTRERLVNRFYENLVPGGYLFIGHSESIRYEGTGFQYVCPAVYRRC